MLDKISTTLNHSDVVKGAFFLKKQSSSTTPHQLRKVINVQSDTEGKLRVSYVAKSSKRHKHHLGFVTTVSNPPFIENFCKACECKLSQNEIDEFIKKGILTKDET